MASLIDDNAELAEIAGAEFTVNYAMLYQGEFRNNCTMIKVTRNSKITIKMTEYH